MNDNEPTPEERARNRLHEQDVETIEIDDDMVTVYAGQFVGHHTLREDVGGSLWASSLGNYVHRPTAIEFQAECPEPLTLEERVRKYGKSPDPKGASREAWRRSRL